MSQDTTNKLFYRLQALGLEPLSGGLYADGVTGTLSYSIYDVSPAAPKNWNPSELFVRLSELDFLHHVQNASNKGMYMLGQFRVLFSLDKNIKPYLPHDDKFIHPEEMDKKRPEEPYDNMAKGKRFS